MYQQYQWPQVQAQPYFQPQQQTVAPQIQGVRAVTGVDEARAAPVPLGSAAMFMDAEKDLLYLKSVDAYGVPSVTTYRYERVEPEPPKEYVTAEQLNAALGEIRSQYELIVGKLAEAPAAAGRHSAAAFADA